ncbi:hypothetical protein OH492_14525 [Vibrio chagasii]|nr:hypothetical protein [Vibrio chagasii]
MEDDPILSGPVPPNRCFKQFISFSTKEKQLCALSRQGALPRQIRSVPGNVQMIAYQAQWDAGLQDRSNGDRRQD